MATPYDNITGIITVVDKHQAVLRTAYSGYAKPGQIVVDTADYSVWVSNATGVLNPVGGSGGGSGVAYFANSAGNITVNAQPNITSVGTLTGLAVNGIANLGANGNIRISGGATGQVLAADGSGGLAWTTISTSSASNGTSTTQVNASNVTTVIGGTTIQTIGANGVTITGNANVSGNVNASYFVGNGSQLTGLNGANVVGNVTSAITANVANFAGNITVNAQPNITSVGTLTGLTVNGISNLGAVGNMRITGGTAGQVLTTDGSGIVSWTTISAGGTTSSNGTSSTQVNASNVTTVIGGTTIQTIGANGVTITGNANVSGNVTASYFIGNGSQLGSLNGANVVGNVTSAITANFANFAGNITVNAQPNITSVGTLTGLTVNGTTSLGLVGNVSIGGGTSGQVLTTNGSGVLTWSTISGGGGTTSSNGTTNTQVNASNVTTVIGGTTIQTTDANGITITGNANVSGNVTASYFIGNGSQLTSLNGSSVVGNVTSAITANFANFAGNVTVNAQPNITSVGTLTGLTSTGTVNLTSASNISLGPVANVRIAGGTIGQVLTTNGSNTLSWTTVSSGTTLTNGTIDSQPLVWDVATTSWIPGTKVVANNFLITVNALTTTTLDFSKGVQTISVSAPQTFTATGTVAGKSCSLTLIVTSTNGAPLTWPTGTQWPDGTIPTFDPGTHIVTLITVDNGTTFYGVALNNYA